MNGLRDPEEIRRLLAEQIAAAFRGTVWPADNERLIEVLAAVAASVIVTEHRAALARVEAVEAREATLRAATEALIAQVDDALTHSERLTGGTVLALRASANNARAALAAAAEPEPPAASARLIAYCHRNNPHGPHEWMNSAMDHMALCEGNLAPGSEQSTEDER
jgi:heme exporter protein D